jgi:hypothetical protein
MSEKLFHVLWEIDLYAESHEDAAQKAKAIQKRNDSIAQVFDVTDPDDKTKRIDLDEGA